MWRIITLALSLCAWRQSEKTSKFVLFSIDNIFLVRPLSRPSEGILFCLSLPPRETNIRLSEVNIKERERERETMSFVLISMPKTTKMMLVRERDIEDMDYDLMKANKTHTRWTNYKEDGYMLQDRQTSTCTRRIWRGRQPDEQTNKLVEMGRQDTKLVATRETERDTFLSIKCDHWQDWGKDHTILQSKEKVFFLVTIRLFVTQTWLNKHTEVNVTTRDQWQLCEAQMNCVTWFEGAKSWIRLNLTNEDYKLGTTRRDKQNIKSEQYKRDIDKTLWWP